MIFTETEFEGLWVIENKAFTDERGSLYKPWVKKELDHLIIDNSETYISTSKEKTFRGLHFQEGNSAQGKFITCLQGNIMDVAVDLRPFSKTYAKVFTMDLEGMSGKGVFIPKGFAHGFYSYTESMIMNICDSDYLPGNEQSILWSSIEKIRKIDVNLISNKDKSALKLDEYLNENNIDWS